MPARRISPRQAELLVEFAEANPRIVMTGSPRGPLSISISRQIWESLTQKLNSVPDGVQKTPEQWRRYWIDFKAKTKAKGADSRRQSASLGGGPGKLLPLNPLEKRVLAFMSPPEVQNIPEINPPIEVSSSEPSPEADLAMQEEWLEYDMLPTPESPEIYLPPCPELEPEPQPVPELGLDLNVAPVPGFDLEPDLNLEPGLELELGHEPESEVELEPNLDLGLEQGLGPDNDVELDSEPDLVLDEETEPLQVLHMEPEPQLERDQEIQPDVVLDTEPEQEITSTHSMETHKDIKSQRPAAPRRHIRKLRTQRRTGRAYNVPRWVYAIEARRVAAEERNAAALEAMATVMRNIQEDIRIFMNRLPGSA